MKFNFEDSKKKIVSLLDEAYLCRINNLKKSIDLTHESLSISRAINEKALIARSLSSFSLFSMISGDFDNTLITANEALSYFGELNDEKGIAETKYSMACAYYKTSNYHLGLVNLIECIGIFKRLNDFHNLSRSHKALGTIYEYFGDINNAVKTYYEAIIAAQKAGDINLESNAYNTLSGIYIKQKDLEKAWELIERSMAIKIQTGDTRGLAFAFYGRGKVFLARKEYEKAEEDFNSAIRIHLQMGEPVGLGMAYHKAANLYFQMGRLDKAKELLNKGFESSNEHNIVMVKWKCFFLFYEIFKSEGDPVNALKYLELYYRERETIINNQTHQIIENYELIAKMQASEKEAQFRSAEMIKKKDIAEQAARLKQNFLSSMSHEIRTPLNAVITVASLLDEKVGAGEKPLVETLKFSANNLLLIVNDFLDFTKLDAGKAQLELRSCQFKNLFENIKNTYHGLAREKGLTLSLNIDEDINEFYELDETKMAQIIGNLVTNAIKFTDSGQVGITIKKIKGNEDTDRLLFEVFDTGVGIEENHRERIFDSFFQLQTIRTRKQGGTGLGLAIVKKLMDLHGSTMLVDSTVGVGSVFYFYMNLKRTAPPIKIISKKTDVLNGKHVLIAEDNLINALLIGKLLATWDMTSDHAKNGIEAVEKSKSKAFDFILMDIHMPEMDGFEATRNIHISGNPNIKTPVFALTADITVENQDEYTELFTDFLRKPLEKDKMYESFIKNL